MPFATLISLAAGLLLRAEDEKNAFTPINAERPGFTNPPSTVQKGRFIIEYGYRQTQGDDMTLMDHGDGGAIRYGVTDRLEARLFLPSYFTMIDPTGRTVGLGDSGFGVKYFLAPARGKSIPSLGLTLDTTIISGSTAFRAARWQPLLRLAAEWDFDEDHSFGLNLVYGQPQGNATDKFDQLAISGCYSWNVGRWQPFVELYANLPGAQADVNTNYMDGGVAYLVSPRLQLDAYAGKGLNGPGRDLYFGFGIAVKF